jgi:DNA polymerase-1
VTRPGWVLVDADYSQIELRILAHIAGDVAMQAAFRDGEDVHAVTASQVFRVPLAEVTSQMRSRAKAVNFGIVYGISAFSLADDIRVPQKEAQSYIDAYLAHYEGVRTYMERIKEEAREQGYVTTLFGRRRYLPELRSSNFNTRSFGERVALNTPIQGTAADVIKLAMVRVRDRLLAEGLQARLVMQIHDELLIEAPENEVPAVCALLQQEMEGAASLSVKLEAAVSTGENWYDAKK